MQWKELESSEKYKNLSESDREVVRDQYFQDFISPNLSDDEKESGYSNFRKLTGGDIQTSAESTDFGKQLTGSAIQGVGQVARGLAEGARSFLGEQYIQPNDLNSLLAEFEKEGVDIAKPGFLRQSLDPLWDGVKNIAVKTFSDVDYEKLPNSHKAAVLLKPYVEEAEARGEVIDADVLKRLAMQHNANITQGKGIENKVGNTVRSFANEYISEPLINIGEIIKDDTSYRFKKAKENSIPDGDINDPSTWTAGKDPSLLGYTAQAADLLGNMLPQLGAAYLTRGRSLRAQMGIGAAIGSMQSGGAASREVETVIDNLTDEELAEQSEFFNQVVKMGASPENARNDLKSVLEREVFSDVAGTTAITGALSGYIFSPLTKLGGNSLGSNIATKGAAEAITEGAEEVTEGYTEKSAYNDAGGFEKNPWEGSFGNAVLGAIGGGVAGSVAGAGGHKAQLREQQRLNQEKSESELDNSVSDSSSEAIINLKDKFSKTSLSIETEQVTVPESDFVVDSEGNAIPKDYQQPLIEKEDVIFAGQENKKQRPAKDGMTDSFSEEYKGANLNEDKQVAEHSIGKDLETLSENANEPLNSDLSQEQNLEQEPEVKLNKKIEEKVADVELNPSEAQKEAGNYKKAHVNIQGLNISIENPKGSERSGIDPNGKQWKSKINHHYGYIKRTQGADGDHVDVFVGDKPESENVFVIDQVDANGKFDEHKVMLGFENKQEAVNGYLSNYEKGWKVGPVTELTSFEFKSWLKEGDTKNPIENEASLYRLGLQLGNPITKGAISKFRERVEHEFPNSPISYHLTEADLPSGIRNKIKIDGNGGKVKGIYSDGKIYVVGDNHKDVRDLTKTVFHELVGHHGLRNLLGDKHKEFINKVWDSMKASDRINTARRHGVKLNNKEVIADEYIAEIAENNTNPSVLDRIIVFLKELLNPLVELGISKRDIRIALSKAKSKLKKGEVGNNSPTSDTRYRTDENTVITPEVKRYDSLVRTFQDKYVSLKRTQQSIEKQGRVITDEANVYEKETLMHGKVERDLEIFERQHIKPLMQYLHKHKIEPEELDLFLYAKHAPERNKALVEFYQEQEVENVSESLSGMSDAEAKQIIETFQSEGRISKLEDAANNVYRMLNHKRNLLKENGLLSDEESDTWNKKYQHYVPLKGFAADEADASKGFIKKWLARKNDKLRRTGQPIVGRGFAIKGKESLKALGRRTTAGSILAHTSADVAAAILRSEKNKVAQSLLKLVENNPDKHYWSIHTAENAPEIKSQKTGMPTKMNEKNMADSNEFVPVKRDGKQYYIKINDPELVAAMRNMGVDEVNAVIRAMGVINRYLSTVSTSLSPDFIVSNFFRDLQTGLFNVLGETTREDGKLKSGKVSELLNLGALQGGYKKALQAIYRQERGKPIRQNNEWDKVYREFLDSGAKTGFFDSKTIEQQVRDIKRLIEIEKGTFKGKAIKYGKESLKFVNDLNAAVENTTRLVAFKYARDVGLSQQKAAVFAKDLTVNFNRRGNSTTVLNATYMFANASIQGSANFVRSLGQNPISRDPFTGKRNIKLTGAQMAGIAMAGAGYMLSMLARAVGGQAEDGEDWFDKIPDYILERNMVFFLPFEKMFSKAFIKNNPGWFGNAGEKTYIKIPLPYGYNIFHNVGTGIEQTINGSKRKSKTWLGKFLTFSVLGSFSPIGTANSEEFETGVVKTVTPTVAKPFVDMALNENYFGSPIYQDRRFINPKKPDSSLGKNRTSEAWKDFAKSINKITGGDEYEKGYVDIAPESFEYLFKYATGGFGTFINNVVDTNNSLNDSYKATDIRKFPIARKLVGKTHPYQDISDFYDRVDEVMLIHQKFIDLPWKQQAEFRDKNIAALKLASLGKAYKAKLKKFRDRVKVLSRKDKLTEFEKKQIKLLEDEQKKLIDNFNKEYSKIDAN
ncbi:LPD38 domain-containing protein [Aliikangiella coralliicola]|uniref:PLxRFG domain-containing protein n=1 Tax=Aliikangiella coralliicola TaxID=2592383 RepID=A0A545U079_9GAMM|nr:LPD38 domain-containing protein [Aliikangiella coralliicola]TQV82870.1 hypothetical protein FLL46_24175 [Aliikangiella coralliicola]